MISRTEKSLFATTALLLGIYVWLHVFPADRWNRVIISDGKGYYAYLPAIFIYNDLHFGFTEIIEQKYYPEDGSLRKGFVQETDRGRVNKYFSGTAVLMLPFFLLAHILSLILGLPADGYSMLYQLSIHTAALFYVFVGLIALQKLLAAFGIGKLIRVMTIVLLTLGTNLFHYTVDAPYMSHVYSFSMIACFIYQTWMIRSGLSGKRIVYLFVLLALIVLIRPVNGLIILFIPLAFFGTTINFKIIRTYQLYMMAGLLLFVSILAIQPILWKIQSGAFIVDSYKGEGFNFLQPHLCKLFFSFQKGWLVYTPTGILAIIGALRLYRLNRQLAYLLIIPSLLICYVLSCWYDWSYADSFSQRPFVDYYVIAGWLMAISLNWLLVKHRIIRLATVFFALFATALNQIQNYQIREAIMPGNHMNREKYKALFLRLTPMALANPESKGLQLESSYFTDMEEQDKALVGYDRTITSSWAYSGNKSSFMNSDQPFSLTYKQQFDTTYSHIMIAFQVFAEQSEKKVVLVLEGHDDDGESVMYQHIPITTYLRKSRWEQMSFLREIENRKEIKSLSVFVWAPDVTGTVYLDDVRIDFYTQPTTRIND